MRFLKDHSPSQKSIFVHFDMKDDTGDFSTLSESAGKSFVNKEQTDAIKTAASREYTQNDESIELKELKREEKEDESEEFDTASDYDLEPFIDDEELFLKTKDFPKDSLLSPVQAAKTDVRKVLLLYNPESGAHKGEKIAAKANELLRNANVEVIMKQLEWKGHAEEICRTVDFTGIDVLVALGGDGTFHECVNGLMKRTEDDGDAITVPIAMIPAGTGNSFALELQGGTKVTRAVKHILRGVHCPIDVARVTFSKESGEQEVVYSFNSIHWGLGSKVAVTAERLRWMGSSIRYTTAALLELMHGSKTLAKIVLEDKDGKMTEYYEEFCLVIANNIISAAKGMKMAPDAKLNDGLIDILLIRSSNTFNLMTVFRKIYDGTHTELPYVEYKQVKSFNVIAYKKHIDIKASGTPSGQLNSLEVKEKVEVEKEPDDPDIAEELIDIDGELKGVTPFHCVVVPKSLQVIL